MRPPFLRHLYRSPKRVLLIAPQYLSFTLCLWGKHRRTIEVVGITQVSPNSWYNINGSMAISAGQQTGSRATRRRKQPAPIRQLQRISLQQDRVRACGNASSSAPFQLQRQARHHRIQRWDAGDTKCIYHLAAAYGSGTFAITDGKNRWSTSLNPSARHANSDGICPQVMPPASATGGVVWPVSWRRAFTSVLPTAESPSVLLIFRRREFLRCASEFTFDNT